MRSSLDSLELSALPSNSLRLEIGTFCNAELTDVPPWIRLAASLSLPSGAINLVFAAFTLFSAFTRISESLEALLAIAFPRLVIIDLNPRTTSVLTCSDIPELSIAVLIAAAASNANAAATPAITSFGL